MPSEPGQRETARAHAPDPQPTHSALTTLGVGALAGFTSCVLLQPFDLLKTRMQQEQQGGQRRVGESRTQRLLNNARTVVHTEGWRGLWRGTVPTVVRNVPGVAAYFYSIHELRWWVAKWQIPGLCVPGAVHAADSAHASTLVRLSTPGNLFTGALARVCIGFALNPITIVKARFESSHYARETYPTILSSLRALYRESGAKGFFRGASATALRDAPYAGVYLATYEKLKQQLGRIGRPAASADRSGNAWVVSLSSLTAGTVATVATHPFDILKTRMQTTPGSLLAGQKGMGMIATARHVLATDGVRALADGLGLRCARKAASGMIGWSIFEMGSRYMADRRR